MTTKKLTDAEKLRRLRRLVREARMYPLYEGGRILCTGGMIVPMPIVLPLSALEYEGIIQRPRKRKAKAHRLAHKLRDPKFYTARTKRAVNSGGAL